MEKLVCEQWEDLKEMIAPYMQNNQGMFHGLRHQAFWEKAACRYWSSGAYNVVFKLVAITFMFPWDNSCCERGFSTMDGIKSRLRARLGPELLDQLMRISMRGPPLSSWDPRPAIAKWRAKKARRAAK